MDPRQPDNPSDHTADALDSLSAADGTHSAPAEADHAADAAAWPQDGPADDTAGAQGDPLAEFVDEEPAAEDDGPAIDLGQAPLGASAGRPAPLNRDMPKSMDTKKPMIAVFGLVGLLLLGVVFWSIAILMGISEWPEHRTESQRKTMAIMMLGAALPIALFLLGAVVYLLNQIKVEQRKRAAKEAAAAKARAAAAPQRVATAVPVAAPLATPVAPVAAPVTTAAQDLGDTPVARPAAPTDDVPVAQPVTDAVPIAQRVSHDIPTTQPAQESQPAPADEPGTTFAQGDPTTGSEPDTTKA